MEELAERTDIIITNANKGRTIVIMNTDDDYINGGNRQLSDKDNYEQLPNYSKLQHNEMVNNTTEISKKRISLVKKTAQGLKILNPKTPNFYITPKIHKKSNRGGPVINSMNCHASEISRFVDHSLQPAVKEIQSYIIDTNDFAKGINNITIPKDSILVIIDRKSLYTSFLNHEGIVAVKTRYDKCTNKTIPTEIITTFLALTLTLNNLVFHSQFYLQIKGCAMEIKCVTTYANIFIAEFEEKYVYSSIKQISVLYPRFTDDIFMIWTKLDKFLRKISTQNIPQQNLILNILKTKLNFWIQ